MRNHRPQPGPLDPKEPPAQPGFGATHSVPANGTPLTNSVPPTVPKNHPSLIKLAQLLGRQVARNASNNGGTDG